MPLSYDELLTVVFERETYPTLDGLGATLFHKYHQGINGATFCKIEDNARLGFWDYDASDIAYLAKHFTLEHLRKMRRNSEHSAIMARTFGYDHLEYWYISVTRAYSEAILIAQGIKPPSTVPSRPGWQPPESAEDIKARIDIAEYISQFVKLRKSGNRWTGLCPFHSEKAGSFFVFPDKQTWHCFGACNTGGDLITFVMKYDGIPFKAALYKLSR